MKSVADTVNTVVELSSETDLQVELIASETLAFKVCYIFFYNADMGH